MAAVVSGLLCAYLLSELILHAIRGAHEQDLDHKQEQLLFTKLRMVRKYYPELADFTYSEIRESYDVDTLWNNIGLHPRRTINFVTTLRAQ